MLQMPSSEWNQNPTVFVCVSINVNEKGGAFTSRASDTPVYF